MPPKISRNAAAALDTLNDASALQADAVGYSHSILMQCFLPYREPVGDDGSPLTAWSTNNGRYALTVQSGVVPLTDGRTLSVGIPYGSRARILLAAIQTIAVRNQASIDPNRPEIPIGDSLRSFMRAIGFGSQCSGGERGALTHFREQCIRIAWARWVFRDLQRDAGVVKSRQISEEIALTVGDDSELRLDEWPRYLILSPTFFSELVAHAVPYDMRALRMLAANARAIDVYCWLVNRLHRIPPGKPVTLPLGTFCSMFYSGPERKAWEHVSESLRLALCAYDAARSAVTVVDGERGRFARNTITLRHAPPPVAARQMSLTLK